MAIACLFPAAQDMQDFRKLKVWQKAHLLAIDVKKTIDAGRRWDFPRLRNQALRAAGSIADTIAEGCGKQSPLELARYCDMSAGSAYELLNQLLRARDLGLLSEKEFNDFAERIEEICRMRWSLAAEVRRQHGSS